MLKSVEWNNDYLQNSVLKSIGADFANGGYGSKPDYGWDGYRILELGSPLLKGTDLRYSDVLPLKTHEFDGTLLKPLSENGYEPVPDIMAMDAHRIEIVGYDFGHCHYSGCRSVATFIVYQRTSLSGYIVNTASTNWCSPEAFHGSASHLIRAITTNILDCLLANKAVFSDHEAKAENRM